MVSTRYMIGRPKKFKPIKCHIDQTLLPVLIDSAALIEGGIESVIVSVRRRPIRSIGIAAISGALLSALGRSIGR